MKQKPISSQTTPILFQHPNAANTVRYKSKSGLVIPSLIVIAAFLAGLNSCTADQHATAAQTEHLVKAGVKP
jgi:hypothetical protein